jgi:hypothetical protein
MANIDAASSAARTLASAVSVLLDREECDIATTSEIVSKVNELHRTITVLLLETKALVSPTLSSANLQCVSRVRKLNTASKMLLGFAQQNFLVTDSRDDIREKLEEVVLLLPACAELAAALEVSTAFFDQISSCMFQGEWSHSRSLFMVSDIFGVSR